MSYRFVFEDIESLSWDDVPSVVDGRVVFLYHGADVHGIRAGVYQDVYGFHPVLILETEIVWEMNWGESLMGAAKEGALWELERKSVAVQLEEI